MKVLLEFHEKTVKKSKPAQGEGALQACQILTPLYRKILDWKSQLSKKREALTPKNMSQQELRRASLHEWLQKGNLIKEDITHDWVALTPKEEIKPCGGEDLTKKVSLKAVWWIKKNKLITNN